MGVHEQLDENLRKLREAGKHIVGEELPQVIHGEKRTRTQVLAENKAERARDLRLKKRWHNWK